MGDIRVAFWNLQNLFDIKASEIAADLEFTPDKGWDQTAFDSKVVNLASVINMMHDGQGPDLLGVCEIENKEVAQRLIDGTGRDDYELAHVESPDIRGIDVSLIYSRNVFALDGDPVGHRIHFRYPTRDIFQVKLSVLDNNAELNILVNHWPSRKQGQYETEPYRIAVAEHCASIVDDILKFSRNDFLGLQDTEASLTELNKRWNRNVLVMGDFNDESFNRSVLNNLLATRDLDHIEEEIERSGNRNIPTAKAYLPRRAYLFNCMWGLVGQSDIGTLYFSESTNTMNLLDQFIVSRGLFYGKQKLKMDLGSVNIFKPSIMTTRKGRPIPFDKKTKKGFSDHFPIECIVRKV